MERKYVYRILEFAATACAAVACRTPAPTGHAAAGDARPLARRYAVGEVIRYVMTGVNEGRGRMTNYTAESEGVVTRAADGTFYEDTRWTRLEIDGQEIALDEKSLAFRQQLSLDPGYQMPFPGIQDVQPQLIGPILDLMTFYVDLHPALHQHRLAKAGDHLYVPHGQPNSWADGTRVILGEDCVDFDLTLVRVGDGSADLRVRHVPPPKPTIRLPADWMRAPVGDAPNNWVQVEKDASASPPVHLAAVGHEVFDVDLRIERPSGRILSARMDNPVDVLQMRCEDESLVGCGDPARYRIHRRIELRPR